MKKNVVVSLISVLLLASMLLLVFRRKITDFAENIYYKDYKITELTIEEKLEDFETFYNTLIQSAPYLNEVNDLYGIDFGARKEYYINEIKQTKNLVQYYGVMSAISEDVVSFHTDVCFPLYSNLKGLQCYQSKETLSEFGMKQKLDAWTDEIEKAVLEYENLGMIPVVYVDGKYIVQKNYLSECFVEMEDYELVSVDGIEADKYLTENIGIYGLHYDFSLNKVYREKMVFNERVGEPVKVIWRDLQGKDIEMELYRDYGVDIVASYGFLFSDNIKNYMVAEPEVYMYRDDANQLEYIKVNSFSNGEGKKLREYLEKAAYQKIVIDLSDCYGGVHSYGSRYLFPALYNEVVYWSWKFKVPDTEANRAMTNDWTVRFGYTGYEKEDFYYYTGTTTYRGKQAEEKEIYYLTSPATGSATDTYLSMIQKNNLGTIVGGNTGGEGLGGSYICDSLKNSSLVYVYYPAVSVETEEGENPCAGTAPDVYVDQTREEYNLEQKYRKEGTFMDYDKRLQYDAGLKWVIAQGE